MELNKMYRILIVDDEVKICEFIQACLDNEGYETQVAYTGKDAVHYFQTMTFDLIILDRMLPDINGEDVCRMIRETSDIPIIMLTAKIEEEDRIEGFHLGCDDYVCKPFNIMELLLRVKAILKRIPSTRIIEYGHEFQLNIDSHQLKIRGKEVPLTNTEYKLLLTLSSNPTRIYTREELLACVIEVYYEKFDRVIDSHIKNLRQKIELDSSHPQMIKTVYGVGYRFGLQK